jgi:hypothetical protein
MQVPVEQVQTKREKRESHEYPLFSLFVNTASSIVNTVFSVSGDNSDEDDPKPVLNTLNESESQFLSENKDQDDVHSNLASPGSGNIFEFVTELVYGDAKSHEDHTVDVVWSKDELRFAEITKRI